MTQGEAAAPRDLVAVALLFLPAYRVTLFRFSEARARSIERVLSRELTLSTGRFRVVDGDGTCELHSKWRTP